MVKLYLQFMALALLVGVSVIVVPPPYKNVVAAALVLIFGSLIVFRTIRHVWKSWNEL